MNMTQSSFIVANKEPYVKDFEGFSYAILDRPQILQPVVERYLIVDKLLREEVRNIRVKGIKLTESGSWIVGEANVRRYKPGIFSGPYRNKKEPFAIFEDEGSALEFWSKFDDKDLLVSGSQLLISPNVQRREIIERSERSELPDDPTIKDVAKLILQKELLNPRDYTAEGNERSIDIYQKPEYKWKSQFKNLDVSLSEILQDKEIRKK